MNETPPPMPFGHKKILVIKLGALGDFIQALGPMKAIRRHHPKAHITLITTAPFVGFAEASEYFDDIIVDKKPKWFQIRAWRTLKRLFNGGQFDRVYDLQNNDRTALYFRLFSPRPEWVGAVSGASHQNDSPKRTEGHAFDGHVQTLKLAGIKNVRVDNLKWMKTSISSFGVRKPYVLLIPGCAPSRPEKRWPAHHYARLAKLISSMGYQPVILGTKHEKKIAREIEETCGQALNLISETSFAEIVSLAHGAAGAIGNDTGPIHMIAATGCPTLALFSPHSDSVRHKPKGQQVKVLQTKNLETLAPEKVLKLFKPRKNIGNRTGTVH